MFQLAVPKDSIKTEEQSSYCLSRSPNRIHVPAEGFIKALHTVFPGFSFRIRSVLFLEWYKDFQEPIGFRRVFEAQSPRPVQRLKSKLHTVFPGIKSI